MEKKIKVQITRQENADYFKVNIGDIVECDFEFYVKGVVGSEVGNPLLDVAKAQAIAARSYAWRAVSKNIAISDASSTAQAFRAPRAVSKSYVNAQAGVDLTKGMLLYYKNAPVASCPYSHNNGGKTVSSKERWGSDRPYLISQPDPWDSAYGGAKKGHGVGMSQCGAKYAASIGVTYDKILAFYYTGTHIVDNYGEQVIQEPVKEEIPVKETNLITPWYSTNNPWYTKPRIMNPIGIVVHTTGCNNKYLNRYVAPDDGLLGKNKYNNSWNKTTAKAAMHGFLGVLADGVTPAFYQTLPWNYKAAGVGKGTKGSYNNSHIQFEICEDGLHNEEHFWKVFNYAVDVCVYLCEQFNIKVENIVGHYEAHNAGYANNHGDPSIWQNIFGDSMDKFRARVKEKLGGEVIMPEPTVGKFQGKYAIVNTSKPEGLNLWTDIEKTESKQKVAKGEVLFVISDTNSKWVIARYNNEEGYVDSQYLVISDDQNVLTGKYAKVNTKYDEGLNLWSDTHKTKSNQKVPKGAILFVKKDIGEWVLAEYEGKTGYANEKYLLEVANPPEESENDDEPYIPNVNVAELTLTIKCFNQAQIDIIEEFIANKEW